jgi:hypothetical protein
MSDGIWRALNTWIHGGSSLVAFVCDVAILVTVATVVRRHRPDAYQGLQTWAIGSLAVFIFTTIGWTALPLLADTRDGMNSYFRMSALLIVLGAALHVVLVVIFIRGLSALAQPPKPVNVEGAPPYR